MTACRTRVALLIVLLGASRCTEMAHAQSFHRGGGDFNALRELLVPPGKSYAIIVTEFFHHGQIAPDGRNVVVSTRSQQIVPSRILQLGPGDFCRLAFQTAGNHNAYEILYGGDPPPTDVIPTWTSKEGLLLETRHFVHCDMNNLNSIRQAFERAKPIGADYVENVFHSYNPCVQRQEPFMSRYSGTLHIDKPGKYGIMTSSHDCSFVVIDGKVTASAPGRHGPTHRVRPGDRTDVQLASGPHPFEYWHVAAGGEAMMIAAWEVNPTDPKPQKPVHIPTENFRTSVVGHLPTESLLLKTVKAVPDYLLHVESSVPLPDNDVPLVRVLFKDTTSRGLKGKVEWDFGDGQTSDQPAPTHIYLRPGTYTIKLAVKRAQLPVETANRVEIDQPIATRQDKEYSLDDYLPVLMRYNPRTLEAASLRQLVAACDAKAAALESPSEESPPTPAETEGKKARHKRGEKAEPEPSAPSPPSKEQIAARRAEADKYVAQAVEFARAGILEGTAASSDGDLARLADVVGPMARDRLGDSQLAFNLWEGAARKMKGGQLRAKCELEAASIAINDLLNLSAAKPLLEAAVSHLGSARPGAVLAAMHRVRGDYFASTGDGKAARKEYTEAEATISTGRNYIERTAWRGAHNRSTEDFIKEGWFDRASAEIHAWEVDFPTEKIDGQLTAMYARYWASRQKYAQAIALAEQLLTVNADSPYMDQLLLLAGVCEEKRGKPDRALATYQSLVKDYPGSPLVPDVKKRIAKLEAAGTKSAQAGAKSK